ncbi:hypothetical protein EUX98_g6011 [Antrodiella citrinella]|uniref:Uncharacterized protein n=1 Tax=Antrodiella citrinella TaxID=2447956 RepID=A0A4S4MQ30_9APHY|nr:hypothetical protein EUX98_g6011 [Antrodiella citrinella]
MISAPSDADPTLKPEETYTLIENFCLGLRRLELFGRARTLRRGWVSVLAEGEEARIGESTNFKADGDGDQTMPMKWDRDSWEAKIKELAIPSGGKFVVPMTAEIDSLRPKSPVRNTSGTPQHLPTGLPHNPVGTSAVLATVNVNRGANAPASGRVMMGPPISVPSLPTGTFESGIINPILNWSDMSNMGGMQSNMGGMQGSPMGMGVQQPAPRIGFSNPPTFGGGFQQPSWETHGAGTWDDSGVFIGNTVGMGGGGGGGMGVPDMSMGGMGAMGMQGMPGMPHGMNGTGVHMGMGQNIGGMGQVGAGMSLPNTPAMGGMQGANNMRGMRVVGNGGLNNMGVGAMSMSNMRVGGMNMSGMNMGHWGGT